eukprot:4786604-Pyramimonas_sp.AAC.1
MSNFLKAVWRPLGLPPRVALPPTTAVPLNDWVTIWNASEGVVLGPSWAAMGLSEGHLGPLLCRFRALLDCLEALWNGSGAILEPPPGGFDQKCTKNA